MKWLDILHIAARVLRRNLTRSLLTALGIIIGIAAVIAVVAVGQGASTMMQAQIASMGNNLLMIYPGSSRTGGFRGGAGSMPTLTAADADALAAECEYITAVSPGIRGGNAQIIYRDNDWSSSVMGVGTRYLEVRNWAMADGAFFSDADLRSGNRVCVVGSTTAQQLFGSESPVGQTIRIRNMPFLALGVLATKGSTTWGQDQDDIVIVPWVTARRTLGNSPFNNVSMIFLSMASAEVAPQAREEIIAILRERHNLKAGDNDDFTIQDITEVTQMTVKVSRIMTILLTSIASISLMVGGIGIMNIMLVSVTERTREIGLRMAVGARRRDILAQFMAEAVVLSGIGGIAGIGLGIGAARVIAQANNWPVLISFGAVILALAVAAGVGIFFGFYPAWRAARLDPIESLRRE